MEFLETISWDIDRRTCRILILPFCWLFNRFMFHYKPFIQHNYFWWVVRLSYYKWSLYKMLINRGLIVNIKTKTKSF